jgi:large subunit ribosomal protein L21
MYAVIRAGGKQYRVAPGDVIRIERTPASDGNVEFATQDILAISGEPGQIGRPNGDARVTGHVVEEGRADKILVFHYKRKKQYKKLRGHRQGFTAVRITEIAFDGQRFTAPEEPKREPKAKKTAPASPAGEAADVSATSEAGANVRKGKQKGAVKAQAGRGGSRPSGKKSAGKTASAARSAAKKSAGKGGNKGPDKGKKGGKK